MLVDSLLVPECIYRPGTFTGLMTLYESNYIKLKYLAGTLEWPPGGLISSSPRDSDLHAEIIRREIEIARKKAEEEARKTAEEERRAQEEKDRREALARGAGGI